MEEIDPDLQVSVVREVWRLRKAEGSWPDAYDMLDFLTERGLSLESVERVTGVEVEKSPNNTNQPGRIRLNWRALAQLPEGQELFEPLPKLVREAAARVRVFPPFAGKRNDDRLTIPIERMVEV